MRSVLPAASTDSKRSVAAWPPVAVLTVTKNELVLLRGGTPLSVTLTWICVLPTWPEVGVQVRTPVTASIVAPVGAVIKENINVFAGMSESVATLVTVNFEPTTTVWSGGEVMDGAVFGVF